ncbi:MAG: hypothetical protein HXY20_14405 [Acidobacteria bacterium]|nr:hypothetical protein [Acidobacteriota bacterium]
MRTLGSFRPVRCGIWTASAIGFPAGRAGAKLRIIAEKAGIVIMPVFEPLGTENPRQAKELMEAAAFGKATADEGRLSSAGATARTGAALALSQ